MQTQAIKDALDECLASPQEVEAAKKGELRDELFGGDDELGSDD